MSPPASATTTTTTTTTSATAIMTCASATGAARVVAIEVRIAAFRFLGKLSPALDGHSRSTTFRGRFSAAHLGKLLLQDRFARSANPLAFHRKYLHQDLVTFFPFAAHVMK